MRRHAATLRQQEPGKTKSGSIFRLRLATVLRYEAVAGTDVFR
jgi:hypothetical protein